MEMDRSSVYRVDIHRYRDETCYSVQAAYAHVDEETGEPLHGLMYGRVDGPGEFDVPFASVDDAIAALEHEGWESDDGMVWRRASEAYRGSVDIALVGICGMETVEYVGATEASEMLGITRQRVCELCRDGRLRATRKAGAWLIERSSVVGRIESDPKPGKPVAR